MLGFDAEAFSSSIVAAKFLQAYRSVNVDFAEYRSSACVPPVWVLGLFFDVCACFGEGCPCWGLDLVDVFLEVFG